MEKQLDDLLGNFKGTLSLKDQKIFFELKNYDHANFHLVGEDGYIVISKIRRKNVLNNDLDLKGALNKDLNNDELIKDDEKSSVDNKRSNKQPTERPLTKFLKQFKQSLIKSSIFNFPLDLALNEIKEYDQECLDPRFLLLSFYQLINQKKVTLDEFIDNNCLAITFVSLSFKDSNLRRVGYSILVKFKQLLSNDSYGTIWRIILDKLSASLNEENQLIQPLIISFFVHIIPFIKKPTYSIHEQLVKFLSSHSAFRFNSIISFIHSMLIFDDLELNSFYQDVALLILKNGLKTEEDFILCLNCKIIDFLLINYDSLILFEQNLRIKILEVLKLVSRLPGASKVMCVEKAFILWLNQIIIKENKIEVLNKINQIINQLTLLNCDFYPLYQNELKQVKNHCFKRIDYLFE